MTGERYEVTLMDQAPGLGSGQRVVVAQVGWKWVRARNEVGDQQYTKILRTVWDTLRPRQITGEK